MIRIYSIYIQCIFREEMPLVTPPQVPEAQSFQHFSSAAAGAVVTRCCWFFVPKEVASLAAFYFCWPLRMYSSYSSACCSLLDSIHLKSALGSSACCAAFAPSPPTCIFNNCPKRFSKTLPPPDLEANMSEPTPPPMKSTRKERYLRNTSMVALSKRYCNQHLIQSLKTSVNTFPA